MPDKPVDETPVDDSQFIAGSPSVELSSNRTSLSFERTRMSADRTLMSIVRTSLSLISFGFTIFEGFRQLQKNGGLPMSDGPRNLGMALVSLGVLLLVMGIATHMHFGRGLNDRRDRLYGNKLLHTSIHYSVTPTFIVAFLLLAIGILAIAFMAARPLVAASGL
jgi:putative membrane protein